MSTDAPVEFDGPTPDERWGQIPDSDSLIERGVDTLDEGYITPDRWSPVQRFGSTLGEMRAGETIEMRLAQEEPELPVDYGDDPDADDDREVGSRRTGRLVAPGEGMGIDREADVIAFDVGLSGGAATAEEAAMHLFNPDADSTPDD